MTQTNIPADVRERIIAAAAELYEQAGRENLPTVDAVRRAARADMNTTSAVMREWRRAQTAQAAPVAVTVPEVVTQGVVSENGIYGHSRFCNTDFDDKLACLNLSGV